MSKLKSLLRRLDRIILGPTRTEIEISRRKPSIFESDNLPAFYEDVQSKFGVKFTASEIRETNNMDGLMELVRVKYRSKHDEIANSHWVWGALERLAEKHLKP